MMTFSFRRTAPWQGSRAADIQHALVVEETLANVRVVLVLVSLVVAAFEHTRPHWEGATGILLVMTAYSLAVAIAVRFRAVKTERHIATFHVVDTVGILLAMLLTGGALSPFSTMFLFVLLAAGYRWGRPETWLTAAAGILVLGVHGAVMYWSQLPGRPDAHLTALRVAYLGLGGLLVGYMAETERVQRYRAWSVSRILGRVRAEAGVVAAVHSVLDELIAQFRASHGVLILEEEGSDRISLWQAERRDLSRRANIRLNQEPRDGNATYMFPVPVGIDAFKVRRPHDDSPPDRASVVALDASGARVHDSFSVAPLFVTPFKWRTAFCVSTMAGEGWKGRLFLFMPFDPAAPREQLGYLRSIVQHVGPALFNLYLQRRLQSRAGIVERARISRELHDGVIQALIGIEMQLEVTRREAAGKASESVTAQIVNIQRLLSHEILNVRDLMQLLKPAEVDAKRLVEHLADTIERFRHRTGIQARLACDADEIDLAPRACREVAGMVQEALANVRKHSGATSVIVRLGLCGSDWQLVVDDNGRGLDFEGYLNAEELEAQRKGPVTIKERARSVGGRLAIHSQPGFGTRLEITIPRKHHA
jgi:signal transduction histidine kinase